MKISNVQAFPIEFPLDVPAHDATGVRSIINHKDVTSCLFSP